jgi:hypothetical protein
MRRDRAVPEPECFLGVFPAGENRRRRPMPVNILWAGIPILLIGGGFVVYKLVGA